MFLCYSLSDFIVTGKIMLISNENPKSVCWVDTYIQVCTDRSVLKNGQ